MKHAALLVALGTVLFCAGAIAESADLPAPDARREGVRLGAMDALYRGLTVTDPLLPLVDSFAPSPRGVIGVGASAGVGARAGAGARGIDPPFAHWDGFETFALEADPSDQLFTNSIHGQLDCGGLPARSSYMFAAVDVLDPMLDPAPAAASRDPFMGGPLPCDDASPGVQAVLMDGRGSRGLRTAGGFRGFSIGAGDHEDPAERRFFTPTVDDPLVTCVDVYLPDLETSADVAFGSEIAESVASRMVMGGVDAEAEFADPDGTLRRPRMLAAAPGLSLVGQLWAPPVDPALGLPTFESKTGEWFTVALRASVSGGLPVIEWWVKDSGTDGSQAILIDDPADTALFETQWARLFPGRDPGTPMAPAAARGGVTQWDGYGVAVDSFGVEVSPDPYGAALYGHVDALFSAIGGDARDPAAPFPGWGPTNRFLDNWCVIGEEHALPMQPALALPYVDDMELYDANVSLDRQGARWRNRGPLFSGAEVVTGVNSTPPPGSDGSPAQSIMQENLLEDSQMREEFSTDTPTGALRPWAQSGSPVSAWAQVRLNSTLTVRGVFVVDNDVDGVAAALLIGATGANDLPDARFHPRLPNPLHDPTAHVSNLSKVDDRPNLAHNAPFINWPTTQSVVPLPPAFFEARLTVFGDGTGQWSVNGTPLEFDAAFYSMDPALEQLLADADVLGGGDGMPPYTRFPTTLRTLDQVQFWSGNNRGGFFDHVVVDDVLVEGAARAPGLGPEFFELPWCDDFEGYNLDEPIARQGRVTPGDPQSAPVWRDLIDDGRDFAAGGRFGDGFVRDGQAAVDDVVSASIDPAGAFGQVLCFENTGDLEPERHDLFFDAIGALPRAVANAQDQPDPGDPANDVIVAWDCYVQDVNTRIVHRVEGEEGVVAAIRLAGMDAGSGVPADEIAIQVVNPGAGGSAPPYVWQSTGVQTPLNQWFRVRLRMDVDGNWSLGMNTAGTPMGPGDDTNDENFDDTAMGAHPDATLLAHGVSRDLGSKGAPVNDVDLISFQQGFDDEGDGETAPDPVVVRAMAADAPRPGGVGRFGFCFYEVESVDAGGTGPEIAVVDALTGAVVTPGVTRMISARGRDVVAVQQAGASNAEILGACPSRRTFAFVDQSMAPISSGEWFLTGRPDVECEQRPPRGGIQNADGVADGLAYNFGNLSGFPVPLPGPPNAAPPPYRNIVLAEFVEIPPLPEAGAEIRSKWYVDNVKLQLHAGDCLAPCPWDLNGKGSVGSADVAFLLGSWGATGGPPFDPADFNMDGQVNAGDLAQLLGAWGPCPCP